MPHGKRRGRRGNKMAAIHAMYDANPEVRNIDVVAALKKKRIKVTPNYVSVAKGKWLQKQAAATEPAVDVAPVAAARRGHKPRKALANGHATGDDSLRAAVTFVRAAGGIEKAKSALATVESVARLLS